MYQVLCVNEFAPADAYKTFAYIRDLILPCRLVKYSHTSTKLNMYFLWKIPTHVSKTEILNKSTEIRDDLLKELPIYHRRAQKYVMIY